MFALRKFNKKGSARHQISIKGIENEMLVLPKREYRVILEASSINFELMSDIEQDAVIDLYKGFLNSLDFPFQMVQKVRSLDLDEYLNAFEQQARDSVGADNEQQAIYRKQMQSYVKYVRTLVQTKKILSRQFYIIVPYRAKAKEEADMIREQILQRAAIVEKGLSNVGIRCEILDGMGILDLFYATYNASDAKQQPLTRQTIDLLSKNYL